MRTLGFTRPASKLPASVKEAEAMGFRVLAAPSLEIIHGDRSEFERLRSCLTDGAPVVFGSTTSVDHCLQEFGPGFASTVNACFTIAIGPGTADRMVSNGIRVDLIPDDHSSYGLVGEIKERFRSGRVVVVRSDSGTDIISEGLKESGLELEDIAVYRLRACDAGPEMIAILDAISDGTLDCMAFTSPMSASSFFDNMKARFGDGYLERMRPVKVAAIGRPTADMLTSLGRPPDMVPVRTTFTDLLICIKERMGVRSHPFVHPWGPVSGTTMWNGTRSVRTNNRYIAEAFVPVEHGCSMVRIQASF